MAGPSGWLDILDKRIRVLTRSLRADFSVYARFLDSGAEIAVDADRQMDTMSLIKVPLLVALMRAVDAGAVSLFDQVVVEDDDKRQGSGVLLHFDPGARMTLKDLVWLMIVISDNTATDLCLKAVGGPEAVNAAMRDLGLSELQMVGQTLDWFRALGTALDPDLKGLPPGEMVRKGWPELPPGELEAAMGRYHFGGGAPFGLGSARALGDLFAQIAGNRCASAESCAQIRTFLEGQQLQERLPKYGFGLTGAHKTGSFPPFIANDGGLFTTVGGAEAILVVLTSGYAGQRTLMDDVLGRIGELVFQAADARGSK